jgi:hypothetical protein
MKSTANSARMRGPMEVDRGYREGHGGPDDGKVTVATGRGERLLVGTNAPLNERAMSVNSKTGRQPPSNKFD